jgi:hypothetical protein
MSDPSTRVSPCLNGAVNFFVLVVRVLRGVVSRLGRPTSLTRIPLVQDCRTRRWGSNPLCAPSTPRSQDAGDTLAPVFASAEVP